MRITSLSKPPTSTLRTLESPDVGMSIRPLRITLWLVGVLGLAFSSASEARITANQPLDIHILYDNSGSMYPGYRPDSGRTKNQTGARFFREYPEFRAWLQDFVARQSILNGGTIAISAFTSEDSFSPRDVREVHPRVPLDQFDVDTALDAIDGWGKATFLSESLTELTRDFEGLVWLITDNIVQNGREEPDLGVKNFFRMLNREDRYRSVHLFKLPFDDRSHSLHSDLAIYGILVSSEELPQGLAGEYDRKFREQFRTARRRASSSSVPLFPHEEHLKLKDLSVAPFDLYFKPQVVVEVISTKKYLFYENQTVLLRLEGDVRSNLTQHSVTGGSYKIEAVGAFEPDASSQKSFGVAAIPSALFTTATGVLIQKIPPTGSLPLRVELRSREPVTLRTSGLSAWIKSAFLGVQAEYRGRVRMSFDGVQVRFERDRMAGIFGVEQTTDVFDFEDVRRIRAEPAFASATFKLQGSGLRVVSVLIPLLIFLVLLGLALWLLLRKESYRITVGDTQATVALRRFGSYRVQHQHYFLGRLTRWFSGFSFSPNARQPEVQIESTGVEGSYRARIKDVGVLPILIEPLHRKRRTSSRRGGGESGAPHIRRPGAPPPPPSGSDPPPPPPGPGSPGRGGSPGSSGGGSTAARRPKPIIRKPH